MSGTSRHLAMPYSHLLRASMAILADEGNMRAGATYHVSRFILFFLDWLTDVGVVLFLLFCVLLSLFGCLFHVNPVAGTLSLLWLCWDSKDCHGRHDERSNRSKKKERNLRLPAPCTSFAFSFHAVSPRPGSVKLLALSYLQARRRSLRDSSLTGHLGQFVVNSWYLRHRCFLPFARMRALVTGMSNPMTALRRFSSSSCAPSMNDLTPE